MQADTPVKPVVYSNAEIQPVSSPIPGQRQTPRSAVKGLRANLSSRKKYRAWENDYWLLKTLSDTESERDTGNLTADSDEDYEEKYEAVGGAFAIAFASPENQEILEPFIDITEEEQNILLSQYAHKESGKHGQQKFWHSPVVAFKNLKTRSQRTLKKHHCNPLFEAVDSLLFSLKFSLLGHTDFGSCKIALSLGDFLSKHPPLSDLRSQASFVSSQVTILLPPIDNNEDDETQLLLFFDFEDSFQRHLLHAVAEFYDLISFSRMCYHDQSEHTSVCCQRGAESPTHRVTVIHARKPLKIHSASSSPSSSPSSWVSPSPTCLSPSQENLPKSLSQFLKSYVSRDKS